MTGGDNRVTYRRNHSYNTRSNKIRKVRTPGGKIVVHYPGKKAKGPICGDTGVALRGIPRLRPKEYRGIQPWKRTVSRAYGGCLSASAVRERIVRAFIIEEQKIVKRVLESKMRASKA